MHLIALFGILLLISLRLIGLIIAIEFLLDLKESKFKILIIGWFIWILAGCSALILDVIENQLLSNIFLLINGMSTTISLLFVMMGLYSYFREVSNKNLVILSVIFTSVPLIAFLLGLYSIAFNITSTFLFLIIIVYSIIPLKERENFRNNISMKSYYWYLIVLSSFYFYFISFIIFVFQGYSFGFYSDEFSIPVFFNYFLGIESTIVLIIYSIHLEYDLSRIQKFKLTDKYSHNLGNIVQVIYSATDLINLIDDLSKEKSEHLDLIQKKCDEASKIIKNIRKNQ